MGCVELAHSLNACAVLLLQELYGNKVAGEMLSALSRLFTLFLQWHGFTCGMDDLLLIQRSESARSEILSTAEMAALSASADMAGVAPPQPGMTGQQYVAEAVAVAEGLQDKYRTNREAAGAVHDMKVTGECVLFIRGP